MANPEPASPASQLKGRIIRTVVVAIIAVFMALGDHWSYMASMMKPDSSTAGLAALLGIYVTVLLVMILVAFKPQPAPERFSPAARGLIVAWDVVGLWIVPIAIILADIAYMAAFFFMGAVATTAYVSPIGYANIVICVCGSVLVVAVIALRVVLAIISHRQKTQPAPEPVAPASSGPDS